MPSQVGKVHTVDGPVDPASLGFTLPHEHLLITTPAWAMPSTDRKLAGRENERVNADNLWWVRRFPASITDNIVLDDIEQAVRELVGFRDEGGRTLVDVTPKGLVELNAHLPEIARRTGVQIVACTAYYAAWSRPSGFADRTIEDVAAELARDVIEGFPGLGFQAGIIGELAIEGPAREDATDVPFGVRSMDEIDPGDELLLRAAARAQRRSGAAITLHPPAAALRGIPATPVIHGILDLLASEGADLSAVVVGHLDRETFDTVESLASLADRGVYVQFDNFGYEGYVQNRFVYPSDQMRVQWIRGLVGLGFGAQVLVSHDVCEKRSWRKFGGPGYGHIPRFIVPILRNEGVPDEAIRQITIENPARMLTIRPPREDAP